MSTIVGTSTSKSLRSSRKTVRFWRWSWIRETWTKTRTFGKASRRPKIKPSRTLSRSGTWNHSTTSSLRPKRTTSRWTSSVVVGRRKVMIKCKRSQKSKRKRRRRRRRRRRTRPRLRCRRMTTALKTMKMRARKMTWIPLRTRTSMLWRSTSRVSCRLLSRMLDSKWVELCRSCREDLRSRSQPPRTLKTWNTSLLSIRFICPTRSSPAPSCCRRT